jgi:hypothetical protein
MEPGKPKTVSSRQSACDSFATTNRLPSEHRRFFALRLATENAFFFRTRQSVFCQDRRILKWHCCCPLQDARGFRLQRGFQPVRISYQIRTYEAGMGRVAESLVGAGNAIGAVVGRRFASGGYTVCICRRDAAKSQALVEAYQRAVATNVPAAPITPMPAKA